MPRYVVLRHECPTDYKPGVHWDFMLEVESVLRTWSLPAPPDAAPSGEAESLADHRLAYLDYEGPILGERGSVARWDGGAFTTVSQSAERVVVILSGTRLRGQATLQREPESATKWRFEYRADD